MSKFSGFRCDTCGDVHPDEVKTTKRIVYTGPVLNGEVVEDLCPDCARGVQENEGSRLKPVKGQKKAPAKKAVAASPAPPPKIEPSL